MTALDLDVVIVTYESADCIAACVESLPPAPRVIVVDNASTDGSADLAAGARLRGDPQRRRTSGSPAPSTRRRETTFGRSTCSCSTPTRRSGSTTWRSSSTRSRDPTVAVAGPRLLQLDGTEQRPWWEDPSPALAWREAVGLHRLSPPDFERSADVPFVVGACFLVRTAAFRAVGGFDERYWLYAEEADLCRRLRDAGWRIRYVADAEAVHVGRRERGGESRERRALRAGSGAVRPHPSRADCARFVPAGDGSRRARSDPHARRETTAPSGRGPNAARRATSLLRPPADPASRTRMRRARPTQRGRRSLEPWDAVWRRNQFLVRELTDADPSLRVLFVEPPSDPVHDAVRPASAARVSRTSAGSGPSPTARRSSAFQPDQARPASTRRAGSTDRWRGRSSRRGTRRAGRPDASGSTTSASWSSCAARRGPRCTTSPTTGSRPASPGPRARPARRARAHGRSRGAATVVVCSPGLAASTARDADRSSSSRTRSTSSTSRRRDRVRSTCRAAPVAVYVGTLHEHRLDVALVAQIAAATARRSQIVLVGPDALGETSRRALQRAPRTCTCSALGPTPTSRRTSNTRPS